MTRTFDSIEQAIEACSKTGSLGKELYYPNPYAFVLVHGKVYEPGRVPEDVTQGAPLQCFGNAFALATQKGWKYVEGFAVGKHMLIHHAWNERPDGSLCDSTWMNTGLAYMGVVFSVERADDAMWNGDASVLDDCNRGWPVLREPWAGEDFTLTWPPSDRLDAMREMKMPLSVTAYMLSKEFELKTKKGER